MTQYALRIYVMGSSQKRRYTNLIATLPVTVTLTAALAVFTAGTTIGYRFRCTKRMRNRSANIRIESRSNDREEPSE